jgi:ferredoxin
VHARFTSNADANENEEPLRDLPQHTVTFRSAAGKPDIAFKATDGEVLRTACLRRGLVSPHNGNARLINCRGLGTCGTCAVEIEGDTPGDESSPPIEPTQRNNVENLRLKFPPHGSGDQSPKLRLACQMQVRGDIVVTKRKGFWGQASACDASEEETTMVDPSDCQTYFGELEYLLDRRSPQKSTDRDKR